MTNYLNLFKLRNDEALNDGDKEGIIYSTYIKVKI